MCERRNRGFTLIELLVVVSIIGILAVFIVTSLNSARSQARDARRESDIKTIQNALEIYYAANGQYPTPGWRREQHWDSFGDQLDKELPRDPLNETDGNARDGHFNYNYFAQNNSRYCNGQAYMLVYNKENSNGVGPNDGVWFCNSNDPIYDYGNAFVVGVSPIQR
jgi:type II secretion system protein G